MGEALKSALDEQVLEMLRRGSGTIGELFGSLLFLTTHISMNGVGTASAFVAAHQVVT